MNLKYERLHGIRFDIKQTEIRLSDNSRISIYELLDQLKKIIIGLIHQYDIVYDYLDVAAYLNEHIIIMKAESRA